LIIYHFAAFYPERLGGVHQWLPEHVVKLERTYVAKPFQADYQRSKPEASGA
jgi:hypothetical protein